jgi:serine/threonine-protein kinase
MAVQPGQKFDRYAIEELIGEGGMGRVYRAFDTRLERRVALKVLNPGGDTADVVAIALREARAAAAIAHPNATAVYDAHEIDGTSFITMEFVAGTSLRSIISGPPVALAMRLRWLVDIAAALDAAHRMGVVHRDVKPENVMVRNDGLVKVLDFGVARRVVIEAPESGAAVPSVYPSGARIAGTPAYMAPEQIRGEELDGRTDQFGWGVLAYELLTGHLPWRKAKDLLGYIAAIVSEDPLPMRDLCPEIPPAVDEAVLRALAKSPADRFPDLVAAATVLARYARQSLAMAMIAEPDPVVPSGPSASASGDPASDPSVALSASSPIPSASAPIPSLSGPIPSLSAPIPSSAPVPSPHSPARRALANRANESPPPSSPMSSGARVRGHDSAPSKPGLGRRRWPFGSGFHEPDFEAPVDLEAHLGTLPPEATCKGLFLADLVQQACKVTTEHDLFRNAQIAERRYVGFRDYPLGEGMALAITSARVLFPRYPLGEGLRRVGQTTFDALMATHIGRSLFGILGRDVEPILLAAPKAFKLMTNVGQIGVEKTGSRTFTLRAQDFPCFLETHQVGVLEGVLRYCGERGRIQIALESLATATIELHLL